MTCLGAPVWPASVLFTELTRRGGWLDRGYPVTGVEALPALGTALASRVAELLFRLLGDLGYARVTLPLLLPGTLVRRLDDAEQVSHRYWRVPAGGKDVVAAASHEASAYWWLKRELTARAASLPLRFF